MDEPVSDPGNGGIPATQDVAALISALSLPSIEPFGPDNAELAGLPSYTRHPAPNPEPASRVSVARAVHDAAVATLAALKCLEDRTAACKAAAVARLLGAADVEAAALALDPWQSGLGETTATAEIATTLCIAQGSATALAHQAADLATHPETRDALTKGILSWRHACTILAETRTLADTPGAQQSDVAIFEADLLAAAPGTTGGGFASRARRMREGMHPETLTTRMREAITKRSLSIDPGKDGMAWLTLHLPAPAALGALVQCTRLARAQQGPDENRTLDQLRADTAAILLLGQALPDACTAAGMGTGSGDCSGARAGAGMGTAAGFAGDGSNRGGTAGNGGGNARAIGVPIGDMITDLAAAIQDGVVEGIGEDPVRDYFEQLEATRNGAAITEPPLPEAQVIITVPVLGLLGITNEPAELAGHGPIPEDIARKLLNNAGTFLRVLTDPITNIPLKELPPDRYRLREAEKTLLRALNETCSFPNCTNPALDTEIDHIIPYSEGGSTTVDNLHPGCRRHHALKHFRDDKDRHGRYRQDLDPDRAGIKLRGWKASTTPDGRVAWTSPSGKYHPPQQRKTRPPAYPKWLKKRIAKKLNGTHRNETAAGATAGTARRFDFNHSPLENLIEYTIKPHPVKEN